MAAYMEFQKGAVVPVHQHENEQLTSCISGLIRLTLPERELVVHPGEVLWFPSGVPHGEMLEETVVIDVFSPPRRDWIEKKDAYLRSGL